MKLLIFLIPLIFGIVGEEARIERARLLAAKKVHNNYLVEGRDIVIQYYIHNIGQSAAVNVLLVDSGFSLADFEIAGGQLQVKFDRIAPGANVSHAIVVRPKKFGYFNFTSAEISYQTSEDSTNIQTARTAEPGSGAILNYRDYDRKFSPHYFDWLVFVACLVPTLIIPFQMWYEMKTKYELSNIKKVIKRL